MRPGGATGAAPLLWCDTMPSREVQPDGAVRLRGEHASMVIERPGPGAVLVALIGFDRGDFGDAPFAELAQDVARHGHVEVFVDTRAALNAVGAVTEQWSAWILANRAALRQMHVLVASKYVQLTAELVRLFSRVEHLVRIYTDERAFTDAIGEACGRPFELGAPRR